MAVPVSLAAHFSGQRRLLASHRGWDPGAAALARRLGQVLAVTPTMGRFSRLVVDLNRSLHHRQVVGPSLQRLSGRDRRQLLASLWASYRLRVLASVVAGWADRRASVVHWSVHTFTPMMAQRVRPTDLGILFDPGRPRERQLAQAARCRVQAVLPGWQVDFNRPYRGRSDGLTTALRAACGRRYLGLEIEVNQRHVARGFAGGGVGWQQACRLLAAALAASTLSSPGPLAAAVGLENAGRIGPPGKRPRGRP